MTEETCRYMVPDVGRCGAHATERHKDTYYNEYFPVCSEHKLKLVADGIRAENAKLATD